MSSVSSVPSTEKVPRKKRVLIITSYYCCYQDYREGGLSEPSVVGVREGFLAS